MNKVLLFQSLQHSSRTAQPQMPIASLINRYINPLARIFLCAIMFACMLLATPAQAQIQLIPNPNAVVQDGYQSFYDSWIAEHNGNLYYRYKLGTNPNYYQLVKYNGTNLTLVPNPDGGNGIENKPRGYGSNLYFNYIDNLNNRRLAKYDGTTVTLIPNPDAASGNNRAILGLSILYGNNLYVGYTDINDKKRLAKYDGTTITLVPNPDAGSGYEGGGVSFVYGGNLYFRYTDALGKARLGKYDGNVITLIANPDTGYGCHGNGIEYNGNLYFTYTDASLKYRLAKYDGTTITLMTNPDAGAGFQGYQIVCDGKLYCQYKNVLGKTCLTKYDGTNMTLIPNPDNGQGVLYKPIVYGNNLYFAYYNAFNKRYLGKYDGTNLTLIPNPDEGGITLYMCVYNNNLYFMYNEVTGRTRLAKYDGNAITLPYSNPTNNSSGVHYLHVFNATNELIIGYALEPIQGVTPCQIAKVGPCETTYSTHNQAICEGSSYTFNGVTYTTTGTYTASFPNFAGCDSIATLNLSVNPAAVITSVTASPSAICAGSSSQLQATSFSTVSALAGSITGSYGSTDGTSAAALFYRPSSITIDAGGNLYVTDGNNHKIRKINPAGVVTTFAGLASNLSGNADDQGVYASFNNPSGVARDASNNIYVADRNNHKIRKINPIGSVSTFAGSNSSGNADGQGTSASFYAPNGLACDGSGNLYVADMLNHKIRKIVIATGMVTTFAGSGTAGSADGIGAAASFNSLTGLACDAAGNVYVADYSNHKIRKITPAGVVTTFAGSGSIGSTDGTGTAASFSSPAGVTCDASGNLYVAEYGKIRKITTSGVVTTFVGSNNNGNDDGIGAAASFHSPTGVVCDKKGNVYVTDGGNHRIRKITVTPLQTYTWSPAVTALNADSDLVSASPTTAPTTAYTVTASTAAGCTAVSTVEVTVTAQILPQFSQVAPICIGATLSALPTTSLNGIAGTWSPAINSAATTLYTFTPTAGQCASASTMTVTVSPMATITNFTASPSSICAGGSSQLEITAQAQTYTWSPTVTALNVDNTLTSVSPTSTTTYTVTASTAAGCNVSSTIVVTVKASPTIIGNITSGGSYCTGGTGVAIGLSNSETGVTYQLKNGATNVGFAMNGTTGSAIAFGNQTTAGTYTVIATHTSSECTADMSGNASITINTNVATPTFTAGATTLCATGTNSTYTATAANSTSIVYSILNGTGASIDASSGLVNNITGNFTVVATALGICGANTTANRSVVVGATLPANFSVTGTATYCLSGSGSPVGLANSETGVNYALYYNGSNANGTIVAGTGAAISFGNRLYGGVYTVVATNTTTGCTTNMTGNATLSVGVVPPALIAGTTTACNAVTLTAYGGTTYAWSGGSTPTAAVNSFSTSGTYTVTVATADGCTATATRSITVNALPNASVLMVNGCNSTTLTASGGNTYSWSGGNAPTAAVNIISTSGTYNVTITDANGCSAIVSQIVTMPNVTEAIFGALSGCGSTVLTANTIVGASYAWSGGNTPTAATNTVTTSGIYTVTITSNGCMLSTTRSVVVLPLPNANITSASPTCNSGSSVLTATGGTRYTWSAGLSTTSAINTVNGSGTYTVTVSNGNGCSSSAWFTVNAIPSPQIVGVTTGCGSVTLQAYYGNTYAWSGGSSTNTAGNTFSTSGTYTVTATSTAGCTATATALVTITAAPTASISGSATGCSSVNLTASGGGSYRWSGGFTPTMASNTVINATTYNVTVTNANGCTATSTFAVTAVNPPVNPVITGNATGCTSTTLTASGGNTYAWSGGNAPNAKINTFTTSGTYTVTITRATGGCTATAMRSISIGGTVQPAITANNTVTCDALALTTSGGTSYAWSGGGTAPTKNVATSGTYTVTVTTATCGTGTASITVSTIAPTVTIPAPANVCNGAALVATSTSNGSFVWSNYASNATNNVINNGTYTVTMTADNGCTATATRTVAISNPVAIISGANIACGSTTLTASGGATYAWSGGGTAAAKTISASGTYTVTVTSGTCTATASKIVTINAVPSVSIGTSAVACGTATLTATPTPAGAYAYTWAMGRNTIRTATNVVSLGGTYNVTVTNANGCSAASNLLVAVPTISAGIAGVTSACGSVTFTAFSNSATPTYAWTGGSTTRAKTITTSGTYTVAITAGACTATASQTVTIKTPATATITAINTTACNSLNLTASGGTYYAWSGGTAPTSVINTAITTGTYTVTVTNNDGCTASRTRAVTINTLPTAGITGTTTACGQVALVATGNTGSTYAWSGGSTATTAANMFSASGIYTVTVTQGVCGTVTASRNVNIYTPPTASITGNNTGLGTVTLTASGGTYYAWSSGYSPTTAVNTMFTDGNYVVTVTDANGCTATASKAITIAYSRPTAPTIANGTTQTTHIATSEINAINTVLVYPNPISAGDLAMKINLTSGDVTVIIDIVDMYGRTVASQNVNLTTGDNTLTFAFDDFPAGVYLVRTTANGQRFETKKVVKAVRY